MTELPVVACSLSADELPDRRRRWLALSDRALAGRAPIEGGLRLTFRAAAGVEEGLRALAELERTCCAFAAFEVDVGGERVTLDVTSSGEGVAAVRQLFA